MKYHSHSKTRVAELHFCDTFEYFVTICLVYCTVVISSCTKAGQMKHDHFCVKIEEKKFIPDHLWATLKK